MMYKIQMGDFTVKFYRLVFILMSLSIHGCSSNKVYQSNAEYSKALNIVEAAGVSQGFSDIKVDAGSYHEHLSMKKRNVFDKFEDCLFHEKFFVLNGVSILDENQKQECGFIAKLLSLSGTTMSGLAKSVDPITLLYPDAPRYNTHPLLMAWIPVNNDEDADSAECGFYDQLVKVTTDSLPDGYQYIREEHDHIATITRVKDIFVTHVIEGGDYCVEKTCHIYVQGQSTTKCRNKGDVVRAPDFLGGYKAVLPNPKYMSLSILKLKEFEGIYYKAKHEPFDNSQFNRFELLKTVSSKLPEWVYIYLPHAVSNRGGVILNKGNELRFIKLKNNSESTIERKLSVVP